MAKKLSLSRIHFRNFKALRDFHFSLRSTNILVGPNNAGKSTILDAIRVLSEAIKRARSKSATVVNGPSGKVYGYHIAAEAMPTSLENVHTDYADTDTSVEFRLTNSRTLLLFFPKSGGCVLIPQMDLQRAITPTDFKRAYPLEVGLVPVLGPVEHKEDFIEKASVQRGLNTRRASTHFRNYWFHFPESFDLFKSLVADTWPGMEIERPELNHAEGTLMMFCRETRIARELFWAGFGFQVWCQILTHIVRSQDANLLVIDEPEIYLHPDVQRQLLGILEEVGPDIILATHSTEILGAADPQDILVIDKSRAEGKRLQNIDEIQGAIELLGSNHNLTLSHLARTQKVVFVEGKDAKLIYRFARRFTLNELASGVGLTVIPLGGFQLDKLKAVAWGIETVLKQKLSLAVVLDRDYRCSEELTAARTDLEPSFRPAHIFDRKEIENYLLVPSAIDRALSKAADDRCKRTGAVRPTLTKAVELLAEVTEPLRPAIIAQYIAKRGVYLKRSRIDDSTLMTETMMECEAQWADFDSRLRIVPGKDVFALLATKISERYGITLTPRLVIDSMSKEEFAPDLVKLLLRLDRFRSGINDDLCVVAAPAAL